LVAALANAQTLSRLDQSATLVVADADADASLNQHPLQLLVIQPLPVAHKLLGVPFLEVSLKHSWTTPEPGLKPEPNVGSAASSYLQVPFAKGAAIGVITVNKAGTDQADQLLLSPSNTSIFGHLSESLALSPDPRWRLTDHQEREGSGGHDQEPADEDAKDGTDQALHTKFQHKRQDKWSRI